MTVFCIADFKIDLARSVITKGENQTQVEPKVLKVLSLLAERNNQVVTHEEIMAHVWQGTEVVPNALQRCIAILRKALGDDARSPSIIATHPRIGYSLLVEARFDSITEKAPKAQTQTEAETQSDAVSQSKEPIQTEVLSQPLSSGRLLLGLSLLVVTAFVLAIAMLMFRPEHQSQQYTQIRQLTQTDAHESHALFSPGGEYIVFNRYAGGCKSHLWARQLSNNQEVQLTKMPGYFGAVTFTGDGRELIFAARNDCELAEQQNLEQRDSQTCWNIATLDFALALASPQDPAFRHQCQAERLVNPQSLSNHQYAFLQYSDERYQLMHYDDLNKQLVALYSSEDKYIYHFDYDPETERFVVISRNSHSSSLVELLDLDGQLVSSETIQLAEGISQNQYFAADFEPQGNYLLAISNNRLFRIDFNGELQQIKTPETNLLSVDKHPVEQHLLAVKGGKDIDVTQIKIGDEQPEGESLQIDELNSHLLPFASLSRTTAQDRNALYQPNGEQIAFISDRSGADQLWLWHAGQTSQLSSGSTQTKIHNFSWSPGGKHLAWVSKDQLAITDLSGEVQRYRTTKPLYSVLSWHAEDQFLVLINDPQPGGLYLLDTKQNKLTALGVNLVEAAWIHQNQLFYSKTNGDVFVRSLDSNEQKIKPLPKLNGKALFIKDSYIYSVDPKSFQLNQYDLQGQFVKQMAQLKPQAWKVTDLKEHNLLLSQFIAINNEIVVLE